MPFFKMEMLSLTLVLHWRTWNRSNCHCNYYDVSSFITFSQQLKYNWTISILNMVPLKSISYHPLMRRESHLGSRLSSQESCLPRQKSCLWSRDSCSSFKRVEKLQVWKGLQNFYELKDEIILCSAFPIMSCIRPLIHGVNFDERMRLSCTFLLEPLYGKSSIETFQSEFLCLIKTDQTEYQNSS